MNRRVLMAIVIVLALILLSAAFWAPPLFKTAPSEPTVTAVAAAATATPVPPTATPAPPETHSLHALVRDAETGSPIAGAAIVLNGAEGTTDDTGSCTVVVSHGMLTPVEVQSPGYDVWQGSLDTREVMNEAIALDVSLTANRVRGLVLGLDSAPLPGATVTFRGQPVAIDGEGRFLLRRVIAGDQVTAAHPGYTDGSTVSDGHSEILLKLEPVEVTVHVRDTMFDRAVADAKVCVQDQCGTTDAHGSVVLRAIPRAATFTATRAGYRNAKIAFARRDELTIELVPSELHGTIRSAETGEPLTKAIVQVGDQVVYADEDGMYHASGLSQTASLFVKAAGYERMTFPLGPGVTVAQYDAFEVCEYDSLPCVDISLPPFAVRGIYASYNLLVWDRARMLELVDMVDRSSMLNAIVVDIKGDFGYVAFESEDPRITEVNAMASPRLPVEEFLQLCKEKGIYTIGRMVIFKDTPLIEARPELAVRHPNKEIFYDREGMAWVDPTKPESWEYSIAVTMEAIRLGFDEIQFDYVRFPSDSTSLEIVRALVYSVESTIESRTAAIRGFVEAAKAAVDRTHAFLSVDMFGYGLVIAPDHDMRIGQRLIDLAPNVDYLCPMIYPSTFESGNLGLKSPKDSPYEVIQISMALAAERTDTAVRPWLQGYWYEVEDLEAQLRAAEEASDLGWCFWNARGQYDESFFVPSDGGSP